uniref:Uncharacterized protein n=1 Tax=Arundo donax TaxID=35708 RepID=A0A0A8Z8G4_ARUDO
MCLDQTNLHCLLYTHKVATTNLSVDLRMLIDYALLCYW